MEIKLKTDLGRIITIEHSLYGGFTSNTELHFIKNETNKFNDILELIGCDTNGVPPNVKNNIIFLINQIIGFGYSKNTVGGPIGKTQLLTSEAKIELYKLLRCTKTTDVFLNKILTSLYNIATNKHSYIQQMERVNQAIVLNSPDINNMLKALNSIISGLYWDTTVFSNVVSDFQFAKQVISKITDDYLNDVFKPVWLEQAIKIKQKYGFIKPINNREDATIELLSNDKIVNVKLVNSTKILTLEADEYVKYKTTVKNIEVGDIIESKFYNNAGDRIFIQVGYIIQETNLSTNIYELYDDKNLITTVSENETINGVYKIWMN